MSLNLFFLQKKESEKREKKKEEEIYKIVEKNLRKLNCIKKVKINFNCDICNHFIYEKEDMFLTKCEHCFCFDDFKKSFIYQLYFHNKVLCPSCDKCLYVNETGYKFDYYFPLKEHEKYLKIEENSDSSEYILSECDSVISNISSESFEIFENDLKTI